MGRKKRSRKKKASLKEFIVAVIILIAVAGAEYINNNYISENTENETAVNTTSTNTATNYNIGDIPEYTDKAYVEINNNVPYFTEDDYTTEAFEKYSEWDELGRSGVAFANICKEIMPGEGEERGEIGSVKDLSGWVQKRYDDIISDKYLYNRCHLIGWQLAGENANKQNLITGTRYLNIDGMLSFENMVAEYIKDNTNSHVLYRVTPIYEGDNLLASGVEMEGWSVEDNGEGICFNVYCYNVQPGIIIDYATGDSKAE
jgi:DNA-entry nuclease